MDLTTALAITATFFIARWFFKEWGRARNIVALEQTKKKIEENPLLRVEKVKDRLDNDVFLVYNINNGKFVCQGFTDIGLRTALYNTFNGQNVNVQVDDQILMLDFSKFAPTGDANG